MHTSPFMKLINILCIIVAIYSIIFVTLHFARPSFEDIIITVSASNDHLETRHINLSVPKKFKQFYLLIYEEGETENWFYFSPTITSSIDTNILKSFLPEFKRNYLLLEGNKQKDNFSFTLTSKYPVTYMSTKEHIFHIEYIIPFRLFLFPNFYYSKHYTFFVDPLI